MDETTSVEQRSVNQNLLNDSHRNRPGSKKGHEGRRPYNLTMENNAPLLLPSGLNSMLKNTTETGDIGIFSIKPSRLPRHPAVTRAAGRTRSNGSNYRRAESQLPYHGPRVFSLPSTIDDRSRLPSYGRDATSEVASLYGSSSQKSSESSKILDDQDRRSYSMTISSFSGYRLANPHSSTSLSSQINQNEAQRPRSSFQYPARLKRPGFRPSSPALTDGGVVDYSRRVEIQRETSSPTCQNVSLRPLSLRSDVNRSTPTTSDQGSSPHGFKRKPVIQRDDAPGECSNHTGTAESSSKANLSPASGSNSHLPNRSAASVPVQNKAHHSSPLYYDYTEDFFNEAREGDHAAEELEDISPPPFLVEKTIHEDRELSSDWSYLAMTDLQGRGFLANEQLILSHEDTKNLASQPADISYVGGSKLLSQDISKPVPENPEYHRSLLGSIKSHASKHNVESIRSNQSSPSQSIELGSITENSNLRNLVGDRSTELESQYNGAVDEPTSSNNPSHIVSPRLQQFSGPPSGPIRSCTNSSLPIDSQGAVIYGIKRKPLSREVSETDKTDSDEKSTNKLDPVTPIHVPQRLETSAVTPILQRSISAQNKRDKSSPYFRARPDSTSSTHPDMKLEDLNPSIQQRDLPFDALTQDYVELSDANQSRSMPPRPYKHSFEHSPVKFPVRQYRSEGSLPAPRSEFTSIQASRKISQLGNSGMNFDQAGPCDKAPSAGGRDDFIPAGVVSPIPIYPARKFLASPIMDDSEPQSKTPFLTETMTPSGGDPFRLLKGDPPEGPTQHFFSKFKLKTGASTVRTKPSPPVTRRWNVDGSYPLDDRRRDVQPLPTRSLRRPVSLTPKLKLKVARASLSSLGTVRINREAAVPADFEGSEILSPEDLFTPPPRLANLFRQVSRHFRPKDEYDWIKEPETTGVGGLDGPGFPAITNDPEQPSGVEIKMHDLGYSHMHPRSGTPLSPYPLASREPSQGKISPESSQRNPQLPHDTAVMPAAVHMGGTQGGFSDYGSQLEDSSHLQSNIPGLWAEQPIHNPETRGRQVPAGAPWRIRDAWDQFQAPNFSEMDDESDHVSTGSSHRLKTTVNGWFEDIKAKMFSCGRSRG
ncbi:hypothetical protein V493_03832 [Pseudogymnoascus sp. VKM F-4281 (FW-2241)]|nr:hypothetical protein V493_03832 [Pseudogymnoascus sp. VKM F-4281 (FW-2241)]